MATAAAYRVMKKTKTYRLDTLPIGAVCRMPKEEGYAEPIPFTLLHLGTGSARVEYHARRADDDEDGKTIGKKKTNIALSSEVEVIEYPKPVLG